MVFFRTTSPGVRKFALPRRFTPAPGSENGHSAEPLAPARPLGAASEVGVLRQVIVHRPGPELRRLTPENRDALLFDDVVWAERAAEEHDAFTDILRGRGVEVLYLEELLADVLENPAARTGLIEATLADAGVGPELRPAVAGWLGELPGPELARRLIAGIAYDELPFTSRALTAQLASPATLMVAPLPNHMFTRDSSTWIGHGVLTHRMGSSVRRREGVHLRAIYRYHPRFSEAAQEILNDESPVGTELEGGDVLVLSESALLVGIGQRTTAAAVELYARRLFEAEIIDELIAVVLPHDRASIHLDTVLTMVDVDAFMIYPPVLDSVEAYVLRPGRRGVDAEPTEDLFGAVSRAIGRPARLIHGALESSIAEREQWDEGTNLVALAPGTVVAYERNSHANTSLREHGIEVLTTPASEMARGRGGPHCLTCPVRRDPI